MGYVYFTDDQKQRANAVNLEDFLRFYAGKTERRTPFIANPMDRITLRQFFLL